MRLLYVEDSATDRDLTRHHFEIYAPDIQIETVATGEACFERLGQATFDVLLLDNHLPDIDGSGVLIRLAASKLTLPVVVVTSAGDEDLVVRLIRLGATDYVRKAGDYLDTLPTIVRTAVTESLRAPHRAHTASRPRRRVVYIERHAADIDLTLAAMTEHAPHLALEIARSAREALALVTTTTVDLVLTDLRMPDCHALDLLREFRHRGVSVPVVVVTGHGDEGDAVAALKLGACDYIIKREGYLTQLPYVIDNAIDRFEIERLNRRLEQELTERRRAEAEGQRLAGQLQQAQKLDALGRLAGGVAHDFNNLLTVILGEVDLLLGDLDETDPVAAPLSDIRRSAQRAAALTGQLLAFSRRQMLQPQHLDLNAVVLDNARMLHRLLGEDVELVTNLAPDLWPVQADPTQIDQVILNLSVNARDAMPTGGRLTIRTSNLVIEEQESAQHAPVPPGVYVILSIRDTGHAIDAEALPRIFEPFFTTKAAGHGTGLGLSTVYGIVKQSEGWIHVDSAVGDGTEFTVYLPRASGVGVAPERAAAATTVPTGGTETILLVEDEQSVRRIAATALRRSGYQVIEAASGSEAVRVSESYGLPIALMITDVVMPDMTGPDLAERLRVTRPATRVLFMSGYTDHGVVRHGIVDGAVAFLQKPFTATTLTQKAREVLEQRGDDAPPTASSPAPVR